MRYFEAMENKNNTFNTLIKKNMITFIKALLIKFIIIKFIFIGAVVVKIKSQKIVGKCGM